jgi:choline dehydrogenase-like flavoprotein
MADCDYVVVGSGAGGGTLAARLAKASMRVVLLEAGGDPRDDSAAGLPEDYQVPGFHPLASENPAMSWNFFVRHFADDERQKADPKCWADPDTGEPSVFYPRAATLGGCTAHNAMIFIAPHDSDWDEIARVTRDDSWRASNMRRYFRRLENCRHRPLWRFLHWIHLDPAWLGLDPAGHGWTGWLPAELAAPSKVARDDQLVKLILDTASMVRRHNQKATRGYKLVTSILDPIWRTARYNWMGAAQKCILWLLGHKLDPSDQGRLRRRAEGLCYTPLSTNGHQRMGARERVQDVAARYPERLRIEFNALATKVIFDSGMRAVGVEYLKGERLYRAHAEPSIVPGEPREIRAAREVILAGGAFNTPQLLMLSGIGPKEVLEEHKIPVLFPLDGVGKNLQDRYEIAVIHPMTHKWESLKAANFKRGDPLYQEWLGRRPSKFLPARWQGARRRGMYIANGAAIAFTRRSSASLPDPDLFCMALLAKFRGYYPNYSPEVCAPRDLPGHRDYLTWAILKTHTVNRAGYVTLRSNDPRDRPEINFRYFDEGDDLEGQDLDAVVEGINFVRKITASLKEQGMIQAEELPGEDLQSPKELAEHVRDTAWGHHASCTCPIGPSRTGGVLTSDFKVHGTQGLRVVDASVFPRIPGFFIASAIYMIAEKAADVILREAKSSDAAI